MQALDIILLWDRTFDKPCDLRASSFSPPEMKFQIVTSVNWDLVCVPGAEGALHHSVVSAHYLAVCTY